MACDLIRHSKLSTIWVLLGIIFLAPKTTFSCVERANVTSELVTSTCYSDCVKYEYSSQFDNSIISEWGLVCERQWLASFTQTVCMFGVTIGGFIFGSLSDRYGRRPALLSACMLQLIAGFAAPFSPSYWTFTAIRFFLGLATAGIMIVTFTLVIELTGPSKREKINSCTKIPWAVGEMILPLLAYYLRSWNTFSMGVAIPNVLFLVYILVLPESPKWLISTGQLENASVIMTRVAERNRLPSGDMLEVAKRITNEASSDQPKVRATCLDLLRNRSIRGRNVGSCVCWFVLGLGYFGGNQYIGQTSDNVYVTIVLAGALQIPGMVLPVWCLRRFGRRATIIGFQVVCAVSNAFLALPDNWFYVKLVMGSVGVSAASGAFTAMYMFTTELFPTVVRSTAMGVSYTSSKVGSMLAPFVAGLGTSGLWVPPAIFAVAPLVGTVACYYLPETKGVGMTDVLED